MLVAAALTALLAVGGLGWGVWQQVHRLQELAAVEAELRPLLASEQERKQTLLDALDRASSPDYTEEWARVNAGMARPGEVRLIIPPLQETPDIPPTPIRPASPSAQQPHSPSFWEKLWERLFGED